MVYLLELESTFRSVRGSLLDIMRFIELQDIDRTMSEKPSNRKQVVISYDDAGPLDLMYRRFLLDLHLTALESFLLLAERGLKNGVLQHAL